MSGIGGSEFILLCLIGLLILGPERLPRVAREIGGWVGKARQLTRSLQRQLEEEVDAGKNFGINPDDFKPENLLNPQKDPTYSPLHDNNDDDMAETNNGAKPGETTESADVADADAKHEPEAK